MNPKFLQSKNLHESSKLDQTIPNKILEIWLILRRVRNPCWCTVVRSDVYGNCLNIINNGSACSVLFLNTLGLFPALRKTLEHETLQKFLRAGNNPVLLKNSTEYAKRLFIALSFWRGGGGKFLVDGFWGIKILDLSKNLDFQQSTHSRQFGLG